MCVCQVSWARLTFRAVTTDAGQQPRGRQALTEARPELGEAASKATKAQQSAAILRNNAQRLRDCFENGRKLQVPLVDPAKWDPDK